MFNRIAFLLLVATIASPLLAQAPQKEGTATVSGLVTLKGEPARNVSVALQPATQYIQKDTLRAKTDDAGRFRFERVKAGRYVVGAVAPGFVAPSENQNGPQGKNINLADGENAEVEIALKLGGVITGRVTDSRGNPIVGEGLQIFRVNERGKPERVSLGSNGMFYATDDRGIYRLYGVQAGRYLVGLGFEQRPNTMAFTTLRVFYQMTYYPDVTNEAQAKPVEVTEGRETTGIDIVIGGLKKNYDIAGRVTYAENGQPAVGLEVGYGIISVGGNAVGMSSIGGTPTNSAGEFRIQNILPGKYAASAQPPKTDNSYSEPVRFEITDSDVEGLELKLHRGSTLSGVAIPESTDPATMASVSSLRVSYTINSQMLTTRDNRSRVSLSPNGAFTIEGLPPGKVSFAIVSSEPSKRFSILRIERDGVPQRDGIDVGIAEQITGVRLVLGSGTGIVRGQARIVGKIPDFVRLFIRARRVDSGMTVGLASQIDPRGQFRIENLPPGEYEIFPSATSLSNEPPPGFEELKKLLADIKQRVTVANNAEAQTELLIDLSRREGNLVPTEGKQ